MSHTEISAVINLDAVQDNALFAMDVTGGIYKRKNGHPISVAEREHTTVALSQLFISFEGYFNRVIYLLSDIDKYMRLSKEKNSVKRLEGLLGDSLRSKRLVTMYSESLVVRNAITHGHLYETKRTIKRRIKVISKIILDYNNTYKKYVNTNTYRTKSMYLHVIPSEIGINELHKCLVLWNKIYFELLRIHKDKAYLSNYLLMQYSYFLKSENRKKELDFLEVRLFSNNGFTELANLIEKQVKFPIEYK